MNIPAFVATRHYLLLRDRNYHKDISQVWSLEFEMTNLWKYADS
jgi:hypothetical protein